MFKILLGITAIVLTLGGCKGVQTQDAVRPLPVENYRFGGPEAPIICYEAEGCVPQGVSSPVQAYQGFKQIANALHQEVSGTSCPTDQGPRAEAQCQAQQASKGEGGSSTPPPDRQVASMRGSVTSVTTVPGQPVSATVVAGVANTGTVTLDVTARHFILPPGGICNESNPGEPESVVEGIEVTPEQSGPFIVPPGAFVMHTLDISVDDTAAIGQYPICALTTGTVGSIPATEAIASGMLTVVSVPLKIDQSEMPTGISPGTQDIDGKVTVTNLSPTKYQGILIIQQFIPSADVVIKSVSMDNGACAITPESARITCTIASMDKGEQTDLDMKFCTTSGWTGQLLSAVTVTVVGKPGSANWKTIGNVQTSSNGTAKANACT